MKFFLINFLEYELTMFRYRRH